MREVHGHTPVSVCPNHRGRYGTQQVGGVYFCGACRLDYVRARKMLREAEHEWNVRRAICIKGHPLTEDNVIRSGSLYYCATCWDAKEPGWVRFYRPQDVMPGVHTTLWQKKKGPKKQAPKP